MRFILLISLFISQSLFAFDYPQVNLSFPNGVPSTVYDGETLYIPLQVDYTNLQSHEEWKLPEGTYLQVKSGKCPSLEYSEENLGSGSCLLNLVVTGNKVGETVSGAVKYRVFGKTSAPSSHHWDMLFQSAPLNIVVIAHPLR